MNLNGISLLRFMVYDAYKNDRYGLHPYRVFITEEELPGGGVGIFAIDGDLDGCKVQGADADEAYLGMLELRRQIIEGMRERGELPPAQDVSAPDREGEK